MAYCTIVENPDASQEQFERMIAHMRGTGPFPPDGQRLILAGPAGLGWRVISVWDAPEAYERFSAERFTPACEELGIPCDRMTRAGFELHTLVAGDLVGTPRPA